MGPIAAVDSVISNYFSLKGRASRSEFWWWSLVQSIGLLAAIAADVALSDPAHLSMNPMSYATVIVALFTVIPNFTVAIRRLHDTGRTGAWYLILFVPVGSLVLLIFMLLPSQYDDNIYGPPPFGRRRSDYSGETEGLIPSHRTARHNPYASYALLDKVDRVATPEMQAARKAQINEYYRTKVMRAS
jgi:uncharacterized membrane protein YhaH (DUF805 family)